ncbi:MAG: Lrp/AsnC family transcriptional regulator [Nanoarchaeota archaeon]|nr:Lrp/AsnC family transcriptional regulator [Nanoarchaeota archaeon]MBU1030419.1 Lrp/AsnC family transcriptional regulator [Nanoarchaeota archaeon]MBU1850307.1 Lrp/AsnC family transcriptional regulator [Nanoarchaeota archaeon]
MELDKKDKRIILALKENSRASIRDIARDTSIRPSTVHQRITKLKENGIIEKFTLKLSNKKVGENFIIFMFVTTTKDLPTKAFSSEHIKEVFGITGEYDLMLKLKFKDVEEFNQFIIDFRKNPEVQKTITMVGTITMKEEL